MSAHTHEPFDLAALPMTPVTERLPFPETPVLVRGRSGYRAANGLFVGIAWHDPSYTQAPWRTVGNDALSDSGVTVDASTPLAWR